MFSNFESSGRHLLIDIRGIKNIDVICNKEAIFNLMNAVCEELDLGILNKNHFQFNNGAITAIYMLRESHISFHSYPEKNFVAMDLYSCKQYENDEVLKHTASFIITVLNGSLDSDVRIIDRRF